MSLRRCLVTEVGHFVILRLEGLEPGLEAELLAGPHHHAAQSELVTGAGDGRTLDRTRGDGLTLTSDGRTLGHRGSGARGEAARGHSLVSSPLEHDFNVTWKYGNLSYQ